MAVVGTDGNGTEHPSWQTNLSLALRLGEGLEYCVENICRPISLRNASYNQELAPNALLIEIGSAGNTQEEAIRSAKLVGEVLSGLIKQDREGD
jgi:stage II sporulation protein P